MALTVALAGSTENTLRIAQCLWQDSRFSLEWVLTPTPKKIGRKQILTPNSIDTFATTHKIQKILIENKINESIKNKIFEQKKPDFFVVVDFGYFIPQWLLDFPQKEPLNIHPSALPKWRGSSPGQFSLLFGDTESAVSVIIMNQTLDQGPILFQQSFPVQNHWTQTEYYDTSFSLIEKVLPQVIEDFSSRKNTPTPQPLLSPTPMARQLSKKDSFIEWKTLLAATQTPIHTPDWAFSENELNTISQDIPHQPLLETLLKHTPAEHQPLLLSRACRAFSPWPGLWTVAPTSNGEKRMKILSTILTNGKMRLENVQIEGKNPSLWNEVKTYFVSGL